LRVAHGTHFRPNDMRLVADDSIFMFAFSPHFSSRFISVSDGWGGGYGGGGGNVNDSWGGGGGTAGGMDPAAMYQMYQQVNFFFLLRWGLGRCIVANICVKGRKPVLP
jgi:hypothetical protein